MGKPPGGHPPVHPEQRFDVVLPGLSAGDLVLGHTEPVEDGQQLLGAEDAPAVGHSPLEIVLQVFNSALTMLDAQGEQNAPAELNDEILV